MHHRPKIADRIDAVLPQQQCGRCGHAACRPYAEAVARGEAINRCAPGGDALIVALAALTGGAVVALDPAFGAASPLALARIDESWCIGCTLCIDACPVDAIVGAAKRMHAVLASLCTGCALCVAPCPVDCIAMVPAGRAWSVGDASAARSRYESSQRRSSRRANHVAAPARDDARAPVGSRVDATAYPKKAAIDAALSRARARRVAADATRR